jgi:hypothetical protein
MLIEKPSRRLTLRQQLTHVEKGSRDLIEHLQATLLANIVDLRDLTRPIRRKSHYPTLLAIDNCLKALKQAGTETLETAAYLSEQLQEIREHARRERVNRR